MTQRVTCVEVQELEGRVAVTPDVFAENERPHFLGRSKATTRQSVEIVCKSGALSVQGMHVHETLVSADRDFSATLETELRG